MRHPLQDIMTDHRALLTRQRAAPSYRADILFFTLLALVIALVVYGMEQMSLPLSILDASPVRLDIALLPEYALRTTLRMFVALAVSLLFTLVVATLAAKSRKAEMVIIPALDILQSVPVLGFLTFTVTFFMGLFPGRQMGVECAAIFAIFTSQAWNMAFSFFQSLRTLPGDLSEVSQQFGFSPWRRFIRLELPFAIPGLVWNMMMSMSGGWFFVVASEAITVGNTTVSLPGIGSWLALAIAQENLTAIAWAVIAMTIVIVLYDQLLFRPVVAWADKFRFEQTASQKRPRSWVYDLVRRTHISTAIIKILGWPFYTLAALRWPQMPRFLRYTPSPRYNKVTDRLWLALVIIGVLTGVVQLVQYIGASLGMADVIAVFVMGMATLVRVVVLIALASVIWVPVGVWIGLQPSVAERLQPLAQFLAAFPANVLFPFAVILIAGFNLNPDIWLSPLMILGTQWYILFNVIAGTAALPTDLLEAARIYGIRRWQWWRQVALPGIFPYYVTGALTASGGSWNASIVSESISWGKQHLEATGLGAYIANATTAADFHQVALGIAVMSVFVIAFNRLLWRPLYQFAERRLRLG
ncbi:ABC transporter permease subunit [Dickeya sp. CFBP 2040]|uniref:ABC transporter permease n=1 Tax=Dickeya sp. CFBP 2040 TaxID=2718531 RepID=UPI00144787C9|nr:ABC transporter permease subunit [Dickeya sp. CFBP 2040]NKI73931.1 ABC transporter permease subunit [Dickeya sp. CFBP 2040]